MKKRVLIGFAALGLALVAAFNVSLNPGKSNLSMLSLANIEALAQGEDDKPKGYTASISAIPCRISYQAEEHIGVWQTCEEDGPLTHCSSGCIISSVN